MIELPRQSPTGQSDHGEDQHDDAEYGWNATDPALKPRHRRREDKCQQHRKSDRHQHRLRPIEHDDHQHTAGEGDPRRN
jgi:hypothetical protein